MTAVTDPNGVQWNVHRRWWPFPDLADFVDFDFISWIFALPFLFLWPFWFAMKGLGVKWRIVVERNHSEVGSELVRGYRRSGHRIDEIAQQLAQGRRSGYSGYSGHFVL
ncbi:MULTISPECIES: hypothetical protein [unclassified Mycobacterium]|uniref:hypothetical protein n=1 Tax=unclassified Mycobacterium TaxID=2642494 RepID=UPI0029C88E54|nr:MULTISPECIES: hypothetical protein [unclassified Mycobacterium]